MILADHYRQCRDYELVKVTQATKVIPISRRGS